MATDAYFSDPLVAELRPRYPRLIRSLATVPDGARHLRRLVDLDQTWVRQQFAPQAPPLVVARGADDAPAGIETFDIIYAGGGLNVLNAAVMAGIHERRVLIFDRFAVGAVHREWNISAGELHELVALGLLRPDEIDQIVQRRYRQGLVRFCGEGLRVRQHDLWLRGVLDLAVDADALTALCLRKIRAASTCSVITNEITFERAVVAPKRVLVHARDSSGAEQIFAGRLLIDGMGATSPIACQLNCGAPYSLVCPTVGAVAQGLRPSADRQPGTIDPDLGEVLVTTEHARDGRQLIWEVFPGRGDRAAIYLFHYAETGKSRRDAPSSLLLPLFEDFFALLPDYKDTARMAIVKPVYGFIPAGYKTPALRARDRKVLAFDRVVSLGDAAALQSPLTFCGFGSNARNLRRITDLLNLALDRDRLGAGDLSRIRAAEAVPALARSFSKFMIARPSGRDPRQVNESLNVFCRVLDELGERACREFFQDRVRWWDYTRLLLRTAAVYPRIVPLTLRTLSWGDGLAWIAAYGAFTATATRNALGRVALEPLSRAPLAWQIDAALWRRAPRLAWRLAAFGAGLRQALHVAAMAAPTNRRATEDEAPLQGLSRYWIGLHRCGGAGAPRGSEPTRVRGFGGPGSPWQGDPAGRSRRQRPSP
jgi:lycopene cyclase CruA